MLKSRILVTGGNGMVGCAVKKISKDYERFNFIFLSSSDGDLRIKKNCIEIFNKYKPKYVIHLAANVGGLFKNMDNNVEMFEDNILINLNVLQTCYQFSVKKVISCLSTCVFPYEVVYPITEELLHIGPPHCSNEGYSYAKRMLEVQSRLYNEQCNCNFINVVPTNLYGPFDNFSLENGHVIPSLINKCYLAKDADKDFEIRGSGKPLRQFLYSYDFADIIMEILLDYNDKDTIIVAPNEEDEVSINYVSKVIANEFRYNKIVFNDQYADGQYKKSVSNKKLMNFLKKYKFTSLEEGVGNTVKWFLKNRQDCRK